MSRAKVLCPRCRSLGLETDCADRLLHEAEAGRRMNPESTSSYELEITLRFAVPADSEFVADLPMGPHELATHMREQWMSEDSELQDVLLAAPAYDYDLQVRPVFVS